MPVIEGKFLIGWLAIGSTKESIRPPGSASRHLLWVEKGGIEFVLVIIRVNQGGDAQLSQIIDAVGTMRLVFSSTQRRK